MKTILRWVIEILLNMLASWVGKEVKGWKKKVEKDGKRKELNKKNIENYKSATTKEERVKSALNLINSTRSFDVKL